MTTKEENDRKGLWLNSKTFLGFFGALFILAFVSILILINIVTQVEDIDEKLAYVPPRKSASDIPVEKIVSGQTVYVPVYSHIYAQGGKPQLLETTLSIRNTDPDGGITVSSVEYFGTDGKMIKNYLDSPLALGPLATTEFLVEKREIKGGSGANFIVRWVSDKPVNKPVIEAVMIGSVVQAGISFARSGVVIE